MKKILSLLTALLFVGSMWAAEYQLIKSVSELEVGAHYVIGATYNTNTYFAATTSSDNNRKLVTATVTNEKVTASETMMTFSLGGSTGAWTFKTDNYAETNGYLNATNTTNNNYLKVVANNDNYGKFSIEITDAGVATIKCTGKNSRDTMFLYQSGQISCYNNNSNASYVKPGLYKEIPADVAAPTFTSSNNKNYFQGTVDITIECATDGASIYYTLDGSNPSSSSTAYSSPFTLDATKTIKAIAIKGVNNSDVSSKTFTLCPTEMTCAQARTAALSVSGNNVPYADELEFTVLGYVTKILTPWANNKITFWMADAANGGNVLEAYSATCDEADAPVVGESVQVTGKLTKYGTNPQFASGSTFTIIPRPYITPSPNSWNFNTVEKDAVITAKTISLSGDNLTDANKITVSAPTGYKVSIGEATPATSLTLTPSDGNIEATINVTPITSETGVFNGNLTIATDDLDDDVTVALQMTVTEKFTVSFSTGVSSTISPITETEILAGIELPDGPDACSPWEFAGWKETSALPAETTVEPTLLPAGEKYYPTADVTLYAVYMRTEGASPVHGNTIIDTEISDVTGSYGDGENKGEYKWSYTKLMKNSSCMQGNSSNGSILWNTVVFPAAISKVILEIGKAAGTSSTAALCFGSSVKPTEANVTLGDGTDYSLSTTCTLTITTGIPENSTFMSLNWTNGASYYASVKVFWGEAGTNYYISVPDCGGETALDNTTAEQKVVKTLQNGMLIIEKAGVRYNVMGQIIR